MHLIQVVLYIAALVCWGLAAYGKAGRWSLGWLGMLLAGIAWWAVPLVGSA